VEYSLKEITEAGFIRPTPIQSQGWPMAMTGRDVIGVAETGSGKTLTYLLPALVHIEAQPILKRGDGPIVLILVPTRELAHQIKVEAGKFGYNGGVKNSCVYGGVPKRDQIIELSEGVEILIATPGRLLDHLENKNTNLKRVTYFVLDEADRMLDMGFEGQIRLVFGQIRPKRQLLLFTATWPPSVRVLAEEYIDNDFLQVLIGKENNALTINKNVNQTIEMVDDSDKLEALVSMFRTEFEKDDIKFLVFLSTKYRCDKLCKKLRKQGWPALATHGDKTQRERDWVIDQFRTGDVPIMIATDLASRGLHVDNITFVINYDMPNCIEDYIHRIGRTGRAGKKGQSVSFFDREIDDRVAQPLVKFMKKSGIEVSRTLEKIAEKGRMSYVRRTGGYRSRHRPY